MGGLSTGVLSQPGAVGGDPQVGWAGAGDRGARSRVAALEMAGAHDQAGFRIANGEWRMANDEWRIANQQMGESQVRSVCPAEVRLIIFA